MGSYFGDFLEERVLRKFPTMEQFAKKVGKNKGQISAIRHGKRPPPMDLLDQWIEVLEIVDQDIEKFLYLAAVGHLPKSVQSRFVLFSEDYDKALRLAGRLAQEKADLTDRVAELEHQLVQERQQREAAQRLAAELRVRYEA